MDLLQRELALALESDLALVQEHRTGHPLQALVQASEPALMLLVRRKDLLRPVLALVQELALQKDRLQLELEQASEPDPRMERPSHPVGEQQSDLRLPQVADSQTEHPSHLERERQSDRRSLQGQHCRMGRLDQQQEWALASELVPRDQLAFQLQALDCQTGRLGLWEREQPALAQEPGYQKDHSDRLELASELGPLVRSLHCQTDHLDQRPEQELVQVPRARLAFLLQGPGYQTDRSDRPAVALASVRVSPVLSPGYQTDRSDQPAVALASVRVSPVLSPGYQTDRSDQPAVALASVRVSPVQSPDYQTDRLELAMVLELLQEQPGRWPAEWCPCSGTGRLGQAASPREVSGSGSRFRLAQLQR